MDGLTFNGKHSYNDFGLIMKSDNRNARPSLIKRELEIDGKDGTWNFGSNRYTNRQIQVTFYYPSTNRVDLRVKMRKIAQWLNCKTASMLVFDDEIDKEYIAMVYDEINIEEICNDAKFTITFDCQPIAELIYNADDIILDTSIMLDHTDIRLGDTYSFTVTQLAEFEVNNFGTYDVRPIINITGSFSTLSININGKTLNYNEAVSNATVVIDNENYTVKKSSANKLSVVTGSLNTFLTLQSGINMVTVDGTNLNCVVEFIFKPKYL